MSNLSDYEKKASEALDLKLVQYERQVAAELRDALDQIRILMSKIYEKYAKNGVLSKADMTQYNRLASLEKQLNEIVQPSVLKLKKLVGSIPTEMYGNSFFAYAWTIDMASGLRLNWGLLNRFAVMENLANPYAKGALETFSATTRAQLRNALNNGLIQGQSYTGMINDLKLFLNKKNYELLRIIRTEGQTGQNAGQADLYTRAKELGVAGNEIWDATKDGHTRPDHRSSDGQKKGADGMFNVGGQKTPYPAWEGLTAAERVNCRCNLRFEIDGYSPQLMRTRDQGVLPYQSFNTWFDEKSRKIWR